MDSTPAAFPAMPASISNLGPCQALMSGNSNAPQDSLPLEMSKCHLSELEDAAHERYDPHRPHEGSLADNAVTTPDSAATEAGNE